MTITPAGILLNEYPRLEMNNATFDLLLAELTRLGVQVESDVQVIFGPSLCG